MSSEHLLWFFVQFYIKHFADILDYSTFWYQSIGPTFDAQVYAQGNNIDGSREEQRRSSQPELSHANESELHSMGSKDESVHAGPWRLGSSGAHRS